MRPVLRPDHYPVAVEGGVYILRPGTPARLTGGSVARWLARLTPYLDGRTATSELTAGLSPERAERVRRLLRELHASGVVRDAGGDGDPPEPGPDGPDGTVLAGYRPEVRYVGYFRDRAAGRFAGWRHRTALVVGAGPLLPALAWAVLRSGILRVEAVVAGGRPADLAALRRVAARARRRDPEQRLACRPSDAVPELAAVGLVLHAIDESAAGPDPAVLERRCAEAGVPLVQVVHRAGEVWSLPVDAAGDGPRWSAVRPRLAAATLVTTGAAGAARPVTTAAAAGAATPVTSPAAFAVAAAAVHHAFHAVTGASDGPEPPRLHRLALSTLESSRHPVLPHPFAAPAEPPTAADLEARWQALVDGMPLTEQDFSGRAVAAVDERLGVLTLAEHDWAQSPLYVSRARVRPPAAAGRPIGEPAVIAAGFTYLTARCRATRAGLARYAAIALDPRRLCGRTGVAAELPRDPWHALAALRAGAAPAAVWGRELAGSGRPRLVPVDDAFAIDGPLPVGVAAGYDWSEALATGLLRHCARLTCDEARAGTSPVAGPVDMTAAGLDAEGARCHAILTDLGELPEVYEITGSLGVPAYAFYHNGRTVATVAGRTAAAALGDGLRRVLRLVQARVHRQPGYAPPPVPELPLTACSRLVRAQRPPAEPLTVSELAERLRTAGRMPVAVPLDHDPSVTAILPYLVNVVIADA